MSRTASDIETFINDLDGDEVATLVELVAGLNPLAQDDNGPIFSADELNLIQRFQQFTESHPEGDGVEPEDIDGTGFDNGEESEDIPGSGEDTVEDHSRDVALEPEDPNLIVRSSN